MFREAAQNIKIKNILWDWNGTLLNDVAICIDCINELLSTRELPLLTTDQYRQIFTFPVREYYVKAGFDFGREPFDQLAVEFIENYRQKIKQAALFPDVVHTLKTFESQGIKQYIVSAMEQDFLNQSVDEKGVAGFFESVRGIHDHYAESKTEIAEELLIEGKLDRSKTWFIGDTLHDHEVATETDLNCILVHRGHQSFERLVATRVPLAANLKKVIDFFNIGQNINFKSQKQPDIK